MELGAQIRALPLVGLARSWSGWRSYGPAAGSAFAHIVLLTVLAGMMAATQRAGHAPIPLMALPQVEVTLVADAPLPVPREPVAAPSPAIETLPTAPKRRAERVPATSPSAPSVPAISTPAVTATDEGEALPAAPSGVAPGLRSLLEKPPCVVEHGDKRGDCDGKWAMASASSKLRGSGGLSPMEKAYPGFVPTGPSEAWVALHRDRRPQTDAKLMGGRIMKAQGIMPGGPGGGPGIESVTGRLPPANWQHQDPAFEVETPSWLP